MEGYAKMLRVELKLVAAQRRRERAWEQRGRRLRRRREERERDAGEREKVWGGEGGMRKAEERRLGGYRRRSEVAGKRVRRAKEIARRIKEHRDGGSTEARRKMVERNLSAIERQANSCKELVSRVSQHLERVEITRARVQASRVLQKWWRNKITSQYHKQDEQRNSMKLSKACRVVHQAVCRFIAKKARTEAILANQHSLQTIANAFSRMEELEVDHAMALMRTNDLYAAMKSLVLSYHVYSNREMSQTYPPWVQAHARNMISALLIATHPKDSLPTHEKDTDDDDDLENERIALSYTAKKWCQLIATTSKFLQENKVMKDRHAIGLLQDYVERLRDFSKRFLTTFEAWKEKDCERLADEVTEAAVDIFLMRLRVENEMNGISEDDNVRLGYDQIMEGTTKHIKKMLHSLKSIIGDRRAKRRMAQAKKKAVEMLKNEDPVTTEESKLNDFIKMTTGTSPTVSRQSSTTMSDISSSEDDELRGNNPRKTRTPGKRKAPSANTLFKNEWLVHEIMLLDGAVPNISFEDAMDHSLLSEAGIQSRNEFWAEVEEILKQNDLSPLVYLMTQLRDKIIALTPNRKDLAKETTDALDVDLVKQTIENNAFSEESYFKMIRYAGERILWLEAPNRNDTTREWLAWCESIASTGSGVGSTSKYEVVRRAYEFLFSKIDEINIDILNAHLEYVAPFIRQHGVDYERKNFDKKLEAEETALAVTEKWINDTMELCASDEHPNYGTSLLEDVKKGMSGSYRKLVQFGFINNVMARLAGSINKYSITEAAPAESISDIIPETFELDIERILTLSLLFHQVASTASLLAYVQQTATKHTGKTLKSQEVEEFKKVLDILLSQEDKGVEDVSSELRYRLKKWAQEVISEGQTCNLQKILETIDEQIDTRVRSVLVECDCPVYMLVRNRLVDLLIIITIKPQAKILASTKREQEIEDAYKRRGLTQYQNFIEERIFPLLHNILKHNQDVHGDLYNQIIRDQIKYSVP